MASYEEKIEEARGKIEGYRQKVVNLNEKMGIAKTKDQQTKLADKVVNWHEKIGKQTKIIIEFEAKIADRDKKKAEEEAQKKYLELLIIGLEKADLGSEDDLLKIILDIEKLEDEAARISKVLADHRGIVRSIVQALPDGWTRNENVYKRYRMKAFHQFLIVLQDNPEYSITVDRLVAILGVQAALPLLKVDKTKLKKVIESGELFDVAGKVFDEEYWRRVRTRKEKTPSVVIKTGYDGEDLIFVDPMLFNNQIECLRDKGLDGSIINPLKKAGINTIGDLCRHSGESLQAQSRIGVKRAQAVIDAVSLF